MSQVRNGQSLSEAPLKLLAPFVYMGTHTEHTSVEYCNASDSVVDKENVYVMLVGGAHPRPTPQGPHPKAHTPRPTPQGPSHSRRTPCMHPAVPCMHPAVLCMHPAVPCMHPTPCRLQVRTA